MNDLQRYAYEHPIWQVGQVTTRHFTMLGRGVSVGLSLNK